MSDEVKDLPPIKATRKSGRERFHSNGDSLDFDLLEFWSWSTSDLVSNATRGVLAEYLVAKALGLSSEDVRHEWDAYDIETPEGTKVEVKSAALIQSWRQKRFSTIQFSVKPTLGWDSESSRMQKVPKRHADVYVLAFLAHNDQATIDPTNLSQWEFFVLPRSFLDKRTRSQYSITLSSLRKLGFESHHYENLAKAVRSTVAVEG